MHEEDKPDETFNQDQQEMFQNPDASLGETRPRTPGEPLPPAASLPATGNDEGSANDADRNLDHPDLL